MIFSNREKNLTKKNDKGKREKKKKKIRDRSYGAQAGLEGQVGLGQTEESRELQVVRTAWASARIQVGPSKVNPGTFARATREKGLSFPECFHAGERELSAENAG